MLKRVLFLTLFSLHIANLPSDIKNKCHGPIGIEKYHDTYKIIYQCEKCKMIHKNIMASDDNMNLIIELSKKI